MRLLVDPISLQMQLIVNKIRRSMEALRLNLTPRCSARQAQDGQFSPDNERNEAAIRDAIGEDLRRQPIRENDRTQIRLLRESSHIATFKFSCNVGKANLAKFLRRFEELTEIEGLAEREKLSAFITAI